MRQQPPGSVKGEAVRAQAVRSKGVKASERSRPIPGRLSGWAGAARGAVGKQRDIRLTWRGQDPVTKGPVTMAMGMSSG